MAEMMKGGAGSPIDNENMKKWLSFYKAQSGGGGAAAGGIPINNISLGNANTAMKQYMEDTQIDAPKIEYEYNPFVPPESNDDDDDTEGGARPDDYSDLVTPSGTPMPGHPDYVAWMTAGGEGLPDHAGSTMADHNGYVGNTFVGIGNALTSAGKVIPGFIGAGLHSIGQGMIGHNETNIDGVPTYTTAGSFAPGAFSTDGVPTFAHGTAGPSSIGTNELGDTVSIGYGAGQVDPGMASAAGFSSANNEEGPPAGLNYGGRDWKEGHPLATPKETTLKQKGRANVNMADDRRKGTFTEMLKGFAFGKATGTANVGKRGGCPCGTPGCPGCGKGYNNGGRTPTIWRSEYFGDLDTIPVRPRHTSKHMPAELQEPVGDPTKHFSYDRFDRDWYARADANPSMRKVDPSFTYRGWQGPSTIRIPSGSRADSTMPPELQSPVGKRVLKEGGPLSIKDQIAIKESEAKIKREDMKAKAEVYNKIKGPLQQGE